MNVNVNVNVILIPYYWTNYHKRIISHINLFLTRQVFPDESVRLKVLALTIKCPAHRGCDWKGKLEVYLKVSPIKVLLNLFCKARVLESIVALSKTSSENYPRLLNMRKLYLYFVYVKLYVCLLWVEPVELTLKIMCARQLEIHPYHLQLSKTVGSHLKTTIIGKLTTRYFG